MFSKLSKLFQKSGDFKNVESSTPEVIQEVAQPEKILPEARTDYAKATHLSHDPFNNSARKSAVEQQERIKSKMELYRKLQKELGKHG
jgi:hypothetical protein